MRRNRVLAVAALCLVLAVAAGCGGTNAAKTSKAEDSIYEVSALSVLKAGVYDGQVTVKELKTHGGFGLGTYEGLDGEMVVLDGVVYRIGVDGVPEVPADTMLVPWASVTKFSDELDGSASAKATMADLTAYLDTLIPTKNTFYAVRIHGEFASVKARSEPRQSKPYQPLAQVLQGQKIFPLTNVTGTLVGIRSPEYTDGVNQPGYHFHFITDDRKAGGHVLDLSLKSGTIQIDQDRDLQMALPDSKEFDDATPVLTPATPSTTGTSPSHP